MDSQNPPEKEKKFKNTKSLKNIINDTKLTKKQSEKFPSCVPKQILDGLWLPSTCSKSSHSSTSKEIFKIVPHDLNENKNCEMIVNPLINYLRQDNELINEKKTEELETKQIELEEKRLKKQNEVDLVIEKKELVENHLNDFKNREVKLLKEIKDIKFGETKKGKLTQEEKLSRKLKRTKITELKKLPKEKEKFEKKLDKLNIKLGKLQDELDNVKIKDNVNYCKKVYFKPTEQAKHLLNRCFGCARKAYNNVVAEINKVVEENKIIRQFNELVINKDNKIKLVNPDRKAIRQECINKFIFEPNLKGEFKPVPYDIKHEELRIAFKYYKGRELKFRVKKQNKIESFTIPHKHLNAEKGVYFDLIQGINKNSYFKNKKFPEEKKLEDLEINYDIRVCQAKTGKGIQYYVCVPCYVKHKESVNLNRVVSIDPGSRTPFTCYDPVGKCFKVSEGKMSIFEKIHDRIDKLKSFIDTHEINEKGLNKLKKKQKRLWEKIKNKRNNFHFQTIKYLISNYDVIILPKFEVSKIIADNAERNLSNDQVRRLQTWGHSYFKQRLIHHAELYGKVVIITDEHYTTKTCGKCFHLNDVGASEELSCSKCSVKIDRDMNASRNILIRTLARTLI